MTSLKKRTPSKEGVFFIRDSIVKLPHMVIAEQLPPSDG